MTYCAAKFYVSTFTEGLARELEEAGAKMRAKVLAPAATKTEFGMVANNVSEYGYDKSFGTYHTSRQAGRPDNGNYLESGEDRGNMRVAG